MLRKTVILGFVLGVGLVNAQMQSRRASIVGSRGDEGKCTIEVRVDIAAEVEVSGDLARIRTLSGQPSSFSRFECSAPLPRNPIDFRFKGIDGRGNVDLVRDPTSTRGTAVVRIEDPKGGSEGYTFDLIWRGGSDYNSGSGSGYGRDRDYDRYPSNQGRYDQGRYDQGRYDDRDRPGRRVGQNRNNVITCASNDGRRTYCEADVRNGVTMLEQHSNVPCRQGSTWGHDRRGIWVDRGCRADFEVRR